MYSSHLGKRWQQMWKSTVNGENDWTEQAFFRGGQGPCGIHLSIKDNPLLHFLLHNAWTLLPGDQALLMWPPWPAFCFTTPPRENVQGSIAETWQSLVSHSCKNCAHSLDFWWLTCLSGHLLLPLACDLPEGRSYCWSIPIKVNKVTEFW